MDRFKLREIGENETFDPTAIYKGTPFTQAAFYGDWQETLGRRVRRFVVSNGSSDVAYFQIVKYPLLLDKSYLYIPYGPVVSEISEALLRYIKEAVTKITKEENAVFTRLDFTPVISPKILSKIFTKASGSTYHSAYFQPRIEWFLKLDQLEEDILRDMHKNTRYSIQLAKKREVQVEKVSKNLESYFESFYSLMVETAKRNGFSLHPKEYYKGIFENLHKSNAYLSIASYRDKILVIDLVIVFGGVANNIFGGSSNDEKARMPRYLAQWEAIRYAKQIGCAYYNFGGISTEDQAHQGWEGLTFFKKKFGGEEVEHSEFFDVVVEPLWYSLYKVRKLLKRIY